MRRLCSSRIFRYDFFYTWEIISEFLIVKCKSVWCFSHWLIWYGIIGFCRWCRMPDPVWCASVRWTLLAKSASVASIFSGLLGLRCFPSFWEEYSGQVSCKWFETFCILMWWLAIVSVWILCFSASCSVTPYLLIFC